MILQLLLGTILIAATVIIHALGTIRVVPVLGRYSGQVVGARGRAARVALTITTVLWLFLLHTVEIWLWAVIYWQLTEFPDFETALYFSTVSFTTLGVGDVLLAPDWRLLSALEAANGILLFGWSTAFLFAVVRRVWDEDLRDSTKS